MLKPFFTLFLSVFSLTIVGQTFTENIPGTAISFDLQLIAGGKFAMGSPENDSMAMPNEMPQRQVLLDSFWIGVQEVKYEEFDVFSQYDEDSDETNHPDQDYSADIVSRPSPQYIDYTYGMGKEGFPAVSMTQQAALRYCQWLYEKTGHFYRLPTEAEWEYACLAGIPQYPIPDTPMADIAWYYENSFEKYHEPAQKQPNGFGLYDMLGNVAEWTLDDYQEDYLKNLPDSISTNPWLASEKRHSRTVRGGSYDSTAKECRCKTRFKSSPRWQERDPQIPKSKWWNPDSPFVGFRVVRPVKELSREEVEAFFEKAIKD